MVLSILKKFANNLIISILQILSGSETIAKKGNNALRQ